MLKKREDLTDLHEDNIESKIEEVKKMDIDEETKYKVINEYNNIKKAKSFKEKAKYEKRIRELLKK